MRLTVLYVVLNNSCDIEVEIRVAAEGTRTILAELTHSELERHGEGYEQLYALFEPPALGRASETANTAKEAS